ncbi:hypothetical protein [Sinorhizobium psoraleae]|uniref:hypothetical protein n=1 Tax=Sinorhizobium psoraleae TaxID=520838 RepID=UPI0035E3C431
MRLRGRFRRCASRRRARRHHKGALVDCAANCACEAGIVFNPLWDGALDVLPVAATELRRKLLAMTECGGSCGSAARMLREIDRVRDESAAP